MMRWKPEEVFSDSFYELQEIGKIIAKDKEALMKIQEEYGKELGEAIKLLENSTVLLKFRSIPGTSTTKLLLKRIQKFLEKYGEPRMSEAEKEIRWVISTHINTFALQTDPEEMTTRIMKMLFENRYTGYIKQYIEELEEK